ncbi:MAG: OFA family MFS transporter [Candidatus Bathyarchaeota archaeon]
MSIKPFLTVQNRWVVLVSATVGMMLIGLYQYSWTIFSMPLQQGLNSTIVEIQLTFTIFTWVSTSTQPIAGYAVDRRGPLLFSVFGGILTGFGWVASSFVKTTEVLYLSYGIGSIGVGIIYVIAAGIATHWFPDRRGLATGIVVFGFGFGAVFFNPIISWIVATSGYRLAFLYMGIIILVALVILGFLSQYPPLDWQPKQDSSRTTSNLEKLDCQFTTREMIKSHQWWLLYIAFILTANTGLMVTAQLTYMGKFFKITVETVILATAVFPFTNGIGRIVGGLISDKIGRERAMAIYFTLQGILSILLILFGSTEAIFVTIIALIGFLWGPTFTFFPAIIADYYGKRNYTVNYGLTYTAKGWGGLLGGYVAALLITVYGGFTAPVLASAVFNFIGVLLVFPKVLRKPKAKS